MRPALALGRAGNQAPRAGRALVLAALVLLAHALLLGLGGAVLPMPPLARVGAPPPVQLAPPRLPPPVAPPTDLMRAHQTVQAPSPPRRERRAPSALPTAAPRSAPQADWPIEPTRLPGSFEAAYRLRRGSLTGDAAMHWRRDGPSYTAALTARLHDGQRLFDWTSRGATDAHGVAPERFVTLGRRGQAAAANFQRAAGRITYAGPTVAHALPPAAQDRLSALVQVAGIVAATPERFAAPGAQVALFVSGARGDAEVWVFESRGVVPWGQGGADPGARAAVHLVREAARPYDQRVELWLDADRPGAPLRLSFVTAGREDDALSLDRLGP